MDEVAVPSALKQGAKASRGKGRYKPKGRMVDTAALGEVKALLGETLLEKLRPYTSKKVRFVAAPCIGACDKAPAAAIGHKLVEHARFDMLKAVEQDSHAEVPAGAKRFDDYCADGGYRTLRALLDGDLGTEQVLQTLDDAALRGLGGAGFPTGRKWRIVSGQPGPRLMAVNGDEGEPGTFKDRLYLSQDPHRMIEGILIAAKEIGRAHV